MRDDCLNPALNKRARHFARKRRIAEAFADAGRFKIAQHLRDCEEVFRHAICTQCGEDFYIRDRCRSRVCPLCGYQESKKRGEWIERMCHGMAYPKMLTLTMPRWTENPRDGIKLLRMYFNELRLHKLFEKCKGGAYQIELKPKEGGWHIHMHAILDVPFLPYQPLMRAWAKIIGREFASVDIKAASTPAEMHYVAKYAAKASDYEGDLPQVVAWFDAVNGSRLFTTFGDWYAREPAAPERGEDDPTFVAACPHCGNIGCCSTSEGLIACVDKKDVGWWRSLLDRLGPPTKDIW